MKFSTLLSHDVECRVQTRRIAGMDPQGDAGVQVGTGSMPAI